MRRDSGSAAVDFTLISLILIPLVLGIMQVGLCLHVRNTMAAAASEGARIAARDGSSLQIGENATRKRIATTIAERFAGGVAAGRSTVAGAPGVEVVAVAKVPALGLFGPSVTIRVTGHAVLEQIS